MRVNYHPEAERELIEAGGFYESRVPGLSAQFLHAVHLAVEKVQEAPTRYRGFSTVPSGNSRCSVFRMASIIG